MGNPPTLKGEVMTNEIIMINNIMLFIFGMWTGFMVAAAMSVKHDDKEKIVWVKWISVWIVGGIALGLFNSFLLWASS